MLRFGDMPPHEFGAPRDGRQRFGRSRGRRAVDRDMSAGASLWPELPGEMMIFDIRARFDDLIMPTQAEFGSMSI